MRLPRWTAAVVFAVLTFWHAVALPMFEGMDEPAHLSSILHFATGEGRPVPGRARLHRSIEQAVALAPGPYHQWEAARSTLGGASYAEWRALPLEERARRIDARGALSADLWQDGGLENWQAQHPPLYYAIVGHAIRLTGLSSLTSMHRAARVISATLFALTGIALTAFITGPWQASPWAALFVCLLPMWFVMGARISNDALAIPALGVALLIAIDQVRRPASEWRLSAWLLAGLAAAVGMAAKAYGLVFLPVAAVATALAAVAALRRGASWRPAAFPVAAAALVIVVNGWWVAENLARGAGIAGQNEAVTLAARGILTLGDKLPYARALVFNEPRQLASAVMRGVAQAVYASNWTLGAAPWWLYVSQLALLGWVAWTMALGGVGAWTGATRSALIVTATAVATLEFGILKSVLDYYILFGETRLAQGFYVWGAGPAFAALLALGVAMAAPRRQRAMVLLQAACLATTLVTDLMFWSGAYERDPGWRSPRRVTTAVLETSIDSGRLADNGRIWHLEQPGRASSKSASSPSR